MAQRHDQRGALIMEVLADIDFGAHGNSADYILEGWGEAEPGHRWSLGLQSTMRLPIRDASPDHVLILDVIPYMHAPDSIGQTVMIALNGKLLDSPCFTERRVQAFRLPPCVSNDEDMVLSFIHLNNRAPREHGHYRDGQPFGLMVLGVRLYRFPLSQRHNPKTPIITRPKIPGSIADGTLVPQLERTTGLSLAPLAAIFASIGQEGCEFGLIQRQCGAEPLDLLRFVNTTTPKLVEGLVNRYAGVGRPGSLRIYPSDAERPDFRVHETKYWLWFGTCRLPSETTEAEVLQEQLTRFPFLRRKFVEDLQSGERIFVLTRAEILTESEALAIFCELNREGANVLLWTVHGEDALAGSVDRIGPGFLRGHLGKLDDFHYAKPEAWLSVMANAVLFRDDDENSG